MSESIESRGLNRVFLRGEGKVLGGKEGDNGKTWCSFSVVTRAEWTSKGGQKGESKQECRALVYGARAKYLLDKGRDWEFDCVVYGTVCSPRSDQYEASVLVKDLEILVSSFSEDAEDETAAPQASEW